MKKRILSTLLAVLMLLSILTVAPISASTLTSGDYEYEILDNGTAEIAGYYGDDEELTIPSEIDGYTVTSIGNEAFVFCKNITSIKIPNSVTNIGVAAFYDLNSLISINIPDGITNIYGMTFLGCKNLTNITIPDSVTSIGGHAFYDCKSLTSITIPNNVINIEMSAFERCINLANITIPDSVTYIGCNVFYNTAYYNDKTNWKNDGLYIGNHLIKANNNISGNYEIKTGTKVIAEYAFSSCENLINITIPNSVVSICALSFEGCTTITDLKIPDSVTGIGERAFYHCTNLNSVTISNSVTSIGKHAFWQCKNLKEITIPYSVLSIGERAFGYHYDDTYKDIKADDFKIYGYTNTEAERYAKDNGFEFISIGEAPTTATTEPTESESIEPTSETTIATDPTESTALTTATDTTEATATETESTTAETSETTVSTDPTETTTSTESTVPTAETTVSTDPTESESTTSATENTTFETEPTETTNPDESTEPTTATEPTQETTAPVEETTIPQTPTECWHINSKTAFEKEPTYFDEGYTGDVICYDCYRLVSIGNAIDKKVLKTPTGLKAVAGWRNVTVSYKKVKGATGYKIKYKLGSKSKTITTTKLKYTIKKLKSKKTYSITVKAYVKSGKKVAYSTATKAKKVKVK